MINLTADSLVNTPFQWNQAQQFRKNAESFKVDTSKQFLSNIGKFTLAYESIHALSVGLLYIHGFAPSKGPGHRATVLSLAGEELGLEPEEQAEVDDAHQKRNEMTYRSPAPPVSKQAADDLMAIAVKCLLKAKQRFPTWFED
jgi:hypothetical protein